MHNSQHRYGQIVPENGFSLANCQVASYALSCSVKTLLRRYMEHGNDCIYTPSRVLPNTASNRKDVRENLPVAVLMDSYGNMHLLMRRRAPKRKPRVRDLKYEQHLAECAQIRADRETDRMFHDGQGVRIRKRYTRDSGRRIRTNEQLLRLDDRKPKH